MNAEQSRQIEQLYLEMFELLMRYARSALKNEALAEEAVQETFRIACQKPEVLCSSPNPKGWLVLALKNTIRNTRKNIASTQRLVELYMTRQPKEITFSEDGIRMNILYSDVADSEDFKLLSELAIEKRSHAEMAAARGISVAACKKRVQRAKEKLKKIILQ